MENEILDYPIAEDQDYVKATFLRRLLAYLFDIAPILIVMNVLLKMYFGTQTYDEVGIIKVVGRYGSFIIWLIYSTFMDSSKWQGTLGKYYFSLRVVDSAGNPISSKQSLMRNASKILSYIPFTLGFIWAAFDKENRTWHDMMSKVYVQQKAEMEIPSNV